MTPACRQTMRLPVSENIIIIGSSVILIFFCVGHEDPWVSFVSEENTGVLMVPGMMFTIEPMVNMGSDEIYTDEIDEWTVRTEDGLPSAQWEVTVLVTETGCEVICW